MTRKLEARSKEIWGVDFTEEKGGQQYHVSRVVRVSLEHIRALVGGAC